MEQVYLKILRQDYKDCETLMALPLEELKKKEKIKPNSKIKSFSMVYRQREFSLDVVAPAEDRDCPFLEVNIYGYNARHEHFGKSDRKKFLKDIFTVTDSKSKRDYYVKVAPI